MDWLPRASCWVHRDFCANPSDSGTLVHKHSLLCTAHPLSIRVPLASFWLQSTTHNSPCLSPAMSYRFLLDPPLGIARKLKISPTSQPSFTTVQGSTVVQDSPLGKTSPGRLDLHCRLWKQRGHRKEQLLVYFH